MLHQLYDTFRIHCSDFVNHLSVYWIKLVVSDSMELRVEPNEKFLRQPKKFFVPHVLDGNAMESKTLPYADLQSEVCQ